MPCYLVALCVSNHCLFSLASAPKGAVNYCSNAICSISRGAVSASSKPFDTIAALDFAVAVASARISAKTFDIVADDRAISCFPVSPTRVTNPTNTLFFSSSLHLFACRISRDFTCMVVAPFLVVPYVGRVRPLVSGFGALRFVSYPVVEQFPKRSRGVKLDYLSRNLFCRVNTV